eukprot:TRINITY_DN1003_c0_g1_i3.p1 TRINITY_DN1003_c0_g1~~TRINITY_DN1003_c0_g1_i3.p1  ORF type:complete len:177 (+),score=7.20 TRINITY_DN1003_c0_g1_i3:87-617(+)
MDMRTLSKNVKNASQNVKPRGSLGGIFAAVSGVIGLFSIGAGALGSFYNVDGGHRAVIFNNITGLKDKVYNEGTHLKIPFIETPVIFNVRSKPTLIESPTGSKGENVHFLLFLPLNIYLSKTSKRSILLLEFWPNLMFHTFPTSIEHWEQIMMKEYCLPSQMRFSKALLHNSMLRN